MPVPGEAPPIARRSAREEVFERLVTWIEEGQLEPGEVIKDVELATKLGVSRTPVREALQMLAQRGLTETRPGRLTRVTEASIDDIARVYAPLSALEALAAELGTPAATEADLREMKAHNERLLEAIESGAPGAARDADRDFHGVLLRLAANPYLSAAIEPMLIHIRRLEAFYFSDADPGRVSYNEHRKIIAAVAARDAKAAGETTAANFSRHWVPGQEPAGSIDGNAE